MSRAESPSHPEARAACISDEQAASRWDSRSGLNDRNGPARLKVRALPGEFGEPLPVLPEVEPHACPHCGGALTYLRDIAPVRIPRGPPRTIPVPA